MKEFAHLHLHTEYSLLDGAVRLDKLFARCAALGQPAVAITDHGNMYGAMSFFETSKYFNKESDFKVKPIIGCEVYVSPDMKVKGNVNGAKPKLNHLVLLCKDIVGYKNLIKIVSHSYTEGFYYKPRIDFDLLSKHSEGLICLSACVAGELPQSILSALATSQGDIDFTTSREIINKYKRLFGDDYYIEIQDHNLRSQKQILPYLVTLANESGVKLVATNDVHYLEKKDSKMQKVLQCIAFKDKLVTNKAQQTSVDNDDSVDDDAYFPTNEFYLKTYDEMLDVFGAGLEESLTNTMEIANKCGDASVYFTRGQLTPFYDAPDGLTAQQYLRKLTMDGINEKYPVVTKEILDRMEYELGTIEGLGFVDYFLIVWDFINYSESQNIPVGPGRGSGAGSIVAYATGITKLDPLKYDLYFERFLNPERVSNPDFDIDFCPQGRSDVMRYVQEKYGHENVAQIVTFGTMASKAAIKDVGRVLDVPFDLMNSITKLMPTMMGKKTIRHILGLEPINAKDIKKAEAKRKVDSTAVVPMPVYESIPDLAAMYKSDSTLHEVLDLAMQIEGMPRQIGLHAAGVIICKDKLLEHAPLSMNGQGIVCTQYNMIQCEEIGLLKMDFLGLTNLTDINDTCAYIEERTGENVDMYKIDYADKAVYDMIGTGDCSAVFQLENGGMTQFMKELKPDCLEDLVAGISLYRPGPMSYIPTFIANKKAPDKIKYEHPALKNNLSGTYGVIVYQEQVMNICRELAGYTLGGADSIRRYMSKKKMDKLQAEKQNFVHGGIFTNDKGEDVAIAGAVANGMKEEVANALFADMELFGSYAFNKSHAAAYAYITYQTAYLKCHYIKEFMSTVLNNRITNIKEITKYLTYLKDRKIPIYPPSVNKSQVGFSVEDDGVRVGLAAIKGAGKQIMSLIVSEREKNGEYSDLMSFLRRLSDASDDSDKGTINKKAVEALIYAGAFDSFGKTRSTLIQSHEIMIDMIKKDKKSQIKGQISFFDLDVDLGISDDFKYPDVEEYSDRDLLKYEKAVTGVYLSSHPLNNFSGNLSMVDLSSKDLEYFVLNSETEQEGGEQESNTMLDQTKEIYDGMRVTMGGLILSAEKKFNKRGQEYGIGVLEDLFGTVNMFISNRSWNSLKFKFIPDNIVGVSGRLSVQSDREPTIWVDKIEEWTESIADTTKKVCCFMAGGESNALYVELEDIASAYIGKDKLYIRDTLNGATYLSSLEVNAELAYPELCLALGAKNVKIG